MRKKYLRGSEWKRWDLHIHTKNTVKNDQFSSSNFEHFCEILFKKAIEKEIAVIGITDYFNIENYLKVKGYQEKIKENLNFNREERAIVESILLIPNVELRVLPVTDKGRLVNFHCLFNPEYIENLEDDFFGSIEMLIGDEEFSMTKSGLIKLGKFKGATGNEEAYIKGIESFLVSPDQIIKLFKRKKRLRENTITVVSNSNTDGASAFQKHYDFFEEVDKNSLEELRKSIYHMSDMIFSGNPNDREYFLGKKKNTKGVIVDNEEIIRIKCGSLKPCIHGSDAHTEEKLFNPDDNRYCWVKGIPSFNGLKQIIYEPEQRVLIQENEPDFKDEKLIIDEVRYLSKNNLFTPKPIFFNKNLNVIIGGKSSGKSILLYNIASTLETNNEVSSITNNKYDFRKNNPDFNFEVKTLSGVSQKLYDEKENSILPSVKYIPQNYLAKLAEPDENKKGKELLKYIRDLLLEDDKYRSTYKSEFLSIVKSNDRKREEIIDNFFNIREDIQNKEKELKTKGNEEVLRKSIENNEKKIADLKKEIGLSDEKIKIYNKKKSELEIIENSNTKILTDCKKIAEFNRDFLSSLRDLKNKKEFTEKSIQTPELKSVFQSKYKFLEEGINLIESYIDSYRIEDKKFIKENDFKRLIIENSKKKKVLEKELEPFIQNIKVKDEVIKIEKIITGDKKKQQAIKRLKKEINDNQKELEKEKTKLFDLYKNNIDENSKIIKSLSERTLLLKEQNLQILGSTKFNIRKFKKMLLDVSDGRSFPEKSYSLFNYETDLIDFNEKHYNEVKSLFESILDEETPYVLSKKTTKKIATQILLDDYFVDYWETTFDGDKMGEMSTGKASFVILMLIVGLSSSKAPILIDQPEDNLDNRSITKNLVKYLRNKKTERQIILVTHNPNIVVNADAENIIVAHQKGQNDKQTSSHYKFDYINGAIEESKEINIEEKDLLKSMGIREHIADVVEGGREAFQKREQKYGF